MAYRKPFTPKQRREAVRAYRSYRKHQSALRRRFPPQNLEQRVIFDEYVGVAETFGQELRKADAKVNVDAMNYAEARGRWLMSEYWHLRGLNG
jgi:hypothetical protein